MAGAVAVAGSGKLIEGQLYGTPAVAGPLARKRCGRYAMSDHGPSPDWHSPLLVHAQTTHREAGRADWWARWREDGYS